MKNTFKFIGFLLLIYFMVAGLVWSMFFCLEATYKLIHFFDNDPEILTIQNPERSAVSQIEEVEDTVSETPESLDDSPALRVLETIENARITAYTTRPEEGTTCLSDSGLNLCYRYEELGEDLIACPNKYKIEDTGKGIKGNEVGIIEVDDMGYITERRYLCADRMAEGLREKNWFDIYMGRGEDRVQEADLWGVRTFNIKIYE